MDVQTMDLNETGASMMVPLTQTAPPPPADAAAAVPPEKNLEYNSKPPQTMDSTPIADIMSMNEVQPGGEDPRAAMMASQQQQPQMMMAQPPQMMMPVAAAAPAQPLAAVSKYPMNLTDEQVEALFVGLVAAIAFSKPLQEKMATMIPKFVTENGTRSMTGLAATGAVAAGLFYFGRRAVLKR